MREVVASIRARPPVSLTAAAPNRWSLMPDSLVDVLERELAAIPKKATPHYIADRLAKVAVEYGITPSSPGSVVYPAADPANYPPLAESELIAAEFHRKNARIAALEAEVAKLKAELGRA
jgi:hypothetical protein